MCNIWYPTYTYVYFAMSIQNFQYNIIKEFDNNNFYSHFIKDRDKCVCVSSLNWKQSQFWHAKYDKLGNFANFLFDSIYCILDSFLEAQLVNQPYAARQGAYAYCFF